MVKKRLRDQHSLPGWEWKDECLWYEGCIYVPEPLHLQLICNHHDHPMAGHFGHCKTIDLICVTLGSPGYGQGPLGLADIRSATRLPSQPLGPPGVPLMIQG